MSRDGGPAFPVQNREFMEAYGGFPGMALRDYFAGQALAAIIGKLDLCGVNPPTGTGATGHSIASRIDIMAAVSTGAYHYADAMLAARMTDDELTRAVSE